MPTTTQSTRQISESIQEELNLALLPDTFDAPAGYDPSDEDEWFAEMDRAYEEEHTCRHCFGGYCRHCCG